MGKAASPRRSEAPARHAAPLPHERLRPAPARNGRPATAARPLRARARRLDAARRRPSGVFTASDRTAYRLLVRAVAIAENPERDASHSSRIHYMRLAAAMLQQFGLTPSSRERVSVANRTDAPDDPIAAAMEEFAPGAPPLRAVE